MPTIINGHATLVGQTFHTRGELLYYGHFTDDRGTRRYSGEWGTDPSNVMERMIRVKPNSAPYEVLLYVSKSCE